MNIDVKEQVRRALAAEWDGFEARHPNLARALDETVLVEPAVQALREDPDYAEAMRTAEEVGAGASVVAFFLAPFFGIVLAIYLLISGSRREIPYGPYLSMGTAAVLVLSCPILHYLSPGMMGLRELVGSWFGF